MADRRQFDAMKEIAASETQPSSTRRPVVASVVPDLAPKLDESLFQALKAAALSADPNACKHAIRAAIATGTSPEDLADHYIPALARDMGDLWCVDQLSFAGVTIGVSRLQAMLREMGPKWSSDNAAGPASSSILLIVGKDVYHTLGAIVLSGQLRRKGFSVKLILGGKRADIAQRIQRTKYQAVFISSSRGERLESLRQIIDVVKTSAQTPPPVVVGGSILEVETANDVTALTGADYATRIPDEALEFCGLHDIQHSQSHATGRT
ncbi:cobalamin B12-binding domain-containing protein [Yoonia sp. F2084L]|uniref:cobalamin B12-binding domain-containing protein n=1 Tax=Yoonia sp. F2084L TaxID=2926419 RepID=UPI001FF0E815|nr:cobalamin B12-binding domain-containing protein [Yoonia sp. F2084L]MCK0097183.1 cobalamin B12-binding domain-containing protein [Yoonia sp. F2084L]